MFKHILGEAGKPAVVAFINGLFGKNYPLNSEEGISQGMVEGELAGLTRDHSP